MKIATKLCLITLVLLLSLPFAQMSPQSSGPRFGLQFNISLPQNEFPFEKNTVKLNYSAKALYRFDLSESFMGQAGVGYRIYSGEDFISDYYKSTVLPVDFRVMYKIFNTETLTPYIFGGVGAMYYNVKYKSFASTYSKQEINDKGFGGFGEVGLGIQFNLGPSMALDINLGSAYTSTDNLNYYKDGSAYDAYSFLGAALFFGGGHKEEPVVMMENVGAPPPPPPPPAPKVEEKQPEPKVEPVVEPPKPVEKAPVILVGINFETNKADITKEALTILERDLAALKANMDVKFTITGFTDSRGSDESNMKLSLKRANAVKTWFVNSGISESRMTVTGLGEANPAAPNDTPANLLKNRRVEINIIQ